MNIVTRFAIVIAVALLYGVVEARAADEWDTVDYALGATAVATLVVDWGQTRTIAKNPDRYTEKNRILGTHPSVQGVDAYFLAATATVVLIAHALPSGWRKAWLAGVVVVEVGVITNNAKLGIKTSF